MPKVSFVISVYNVAPYIERACRCLFEQTLDDLEFVFVDDASPDESMAIMWRVLEEYPNRKPQVKRVKLKVKKKLKSTEQKVKNNLLSLELKVKKNLQF